MFSTYPFCVSVHRGVPQHPGPDRGTPSFLIGKQNILFDQGVNSSFPMGVPLPGQDGGIPFRGQAGVVPSIQGTLFPGLDRGVLIPRPGRGDSPVQTWENSIALIQTWDGGTPIQVRSQVLSEQHSEHLLSLRLYAFVCCTQENFQCFRQIYSM